MIKFNKKWNIIPIELHKKKPLIKWKDYQKQLFNKEHLNYYEPCNYGVVCGSISNNLVIIDFDFTSKPIFENILKDLRTHFYEASKTLIVATPHGLHIYYYIDGEVPNRRTQLKSPFDEIKAIDILGEGGYALIPPSQINDDEFYIEITKHNPATISKELFNKIIKFYTIQEKDGLRLHFSN